MVSFTFKLALLVGAATVTYAMPAEIFERDDDVLETIVFKRDSVLTPRDLELAKLHGVDIREMYKHSVIRRADGDDHTIWVHNSFNESVPDKAFEDFEDNADGLEKRQNHRVVGEFSTQQDADLTSDMCGPSTFTSQTGPNSPFTGGVNRMVWWGARTRGFFILRPGCCSQHVNLIVAGSNNGANARFGAQQGVLRRNRFVWIGALDIADLARDSIRLHQRNIGGWRVAVAGGMDCRPTYGNRRIYTRWIIYQSSAII